MGITEILIALAKIFVLLIPGFLLKKLNIVNDGQIGGISSIIICVTYPCLVIHAMQMPFSLEILNNCKNVALIYIGIIAFAFVSSKIVEKTVKLPKGQAGLMTFMLIFGNTGFIGLPILNGLFGPKAVFYGAICDLVSSVLMFTFGVAVIRAAASAGKGLSPGKKDTLKGILNPGVVGVVIGLILFASNTTLPSILGEPVRIMGEATTPLAMFVVGAKLSEVKVKELIRSGHVYLICFFKLILTPLAALSLAWLFIGTGSLLTTVIVMEAAMPVAMSSVIFSHQYKGDVDFAAKGVLASTLLCIITIPLAAILLTVV